MGIGIVLRDRGGRDTPVDGAAKRGEPIGKYTLGDVLGQHKHVVVG